jgi:predicted Fe-S protein YdhL (DUF1289 family)
VTGWRKRQIKEHEMTDKVAQEKALQALHNENERLGLYKDAYGQPEQEPCVHAKTPKECYRVRCQLGDKCVDDEMSFRTTPPQRTWVGLTNQERSECWDTIPERAMKKVEAILKERNQ